MAVQAKHFAPLFEKAGAIVIDNSSQWRMAEDIDLIVPEVMNLHLQEVSLPIQTALRFNLLYL
ncbi:Aspartate-semialdehyde dehydrogenase [Staphylococcus aureus]|uniref:Aspartate-semialdehyde dehydrogenase n=1 Tax=Staphylococcus aureus TaxID=1280 RepID=A0A380EJR4_STAAU|nr:Aspartate-semialdehyde dehydrogenase [Staphylococcus aureus]